MAARIFSPTILFYIERLWHMNNCIWTIAVRRGLKSIFVLRLLNAATLHGHFAPPVIWRIGDCVVFDRAATDLQNGFTGFRKNDVDWATIPGHPWIGVKRFQTHRIVRFAKLKNHR